ncbi:MAG: ribonuclease HII [Syntrophomonadaceae bacterium]|jgi:ribonuclease HII|nr:ribonuclease HII [Syntrophomonadaceae bacterium]
MGKKDLNSLEEQERIEKLKEFEKAAYKNGYKLLAGIDEAGRGPLAGPVTAAAVILPPDFYLAGVDDSKKLNARTRLELSAHIKEKALTWAVCFISPVYLDRVNIYNAAREAMQTAVLSLAIKPDFLLVDAMKLPGLSIDYQSIIKGDSLSISIACASILAKVERDRCMENFDSIYPHYGFARHKGYATREHLEKISCHGACPIHRTSFEPIKTMVGLPPLSQQELFKL